MGGSGDRDFGEVGGRGIAGMVGVRIVTGNFGEALRNYHE